MKKPDREIERELEEEIGRLSAEVVVLRAANRDLWTLYNSPAYDPKRDAPVVEAMACAMWIDYAAGGGVRATAAHWRENAGKANEKGKDGFRRSARVALKAYRKAVVK